jgi:flagellar basal-body rod protein FlgC
MTLLRTFDVTATGMSAQRTRMNVAAMNIANQNTTRTAEGGPYRRRDVALSTTDVPGPSFAGALASELGFEDEPDAIGVAVDEIVVSDDDPVLIYDPGHPDADPTGHVAMPNVSGIKEMVNMMGAARAYEAGTSVLSTLSTMAEHATRIGK